MGRADRARRIVAGAAVGGGAVGLVGSAVGLLWAQSRIARRRVGMPRGEPFAVDGRYWALGEDDDSPGSDPAPLRMAMLGDSAAAGLGAADPEDTPALLIARGLARASGRPVDLVNLAAVGAQTSAVPAQVMGAVEAFDGGPPHLAVIMIGANDVTHRVSPRTSVRHLVCAIDTLRETGCAVVVACCPDLGTVESVPNPLRAVGRRLSRTLAAAQALATEQAGGHAVELGALLGPEFAAKPGEYFSEDRFHPSSVGYRRAGETILPAVLTVMVLAGPAPLTAPAGAEPG